MQSLEEIRPVEGVQDYLLKEWITAEECNRVIRADGHVDCYHDGTYDWYAGFSKFAPKGNVLEVGVYMGYSMVAFLKGRHHGHVVLVDNDKERKASLMETAERLRKEFPLTEFETVQANTQTDEWARVPRYEFDLIHLDADHKYEGVLNDLRHFAPLVSMNGLVVIHDTADPPVQKACEEFFVENRGVFEAISIPTVNGNIVFRRLPVLAEGI